jgi:hypothetical protein
VEIVLVPQFMTTQEVHKNSSMKGVYAPTFAEAIRASVWSGAVSYPGYITRTYLSRLTDFGREVHANCVNQHFFLTDLGWEVHANSVVGAC